MRVLDFTDGFTSAAEPTQGTINNNAAKTFADDAAYVTDKGSAAADGDFYYNTTNDTLRLYANSAWVNVNKQLQVFSSTANFLTWKLTTVADGDAFYDSTDDVVKVYQDGAWVSHDIDGFTPTTTKGDLLVENGSNVTRLGVGLDNQVLTADSGEGTGIKWATPATAEGLINYITNSDFETDTTGWAAYADAAAEDPVDGTGGSPTVTVTRTVSTPLKGTGSGLLTKDAADRQGEGISYDFSIDEGAQGSVHRISFWYSGSANFASGSSSDIRIWIYDKTGTALIEPRRTIIKDSDGIAIIDFESDSASTEYRLIFHVATTNALAYTFKIDEVSVTPIVEIDHSYIMADTGNGYGSTDNKIRRFSNFTTVGTDIVSADTAANGSTFTIMTSDNYTISYIDNSTSAADFQVGLSVDATLLTTSIAGLTKAQGHLMHSRGFTANESKLVSVRRWFDKESVIRAHTDGNPNRSDIAVTLFISRG